MRQETKRCRYMRSFLNDWTRKDMLTYLRGAKRDAFSMAFDRARDQQIEIIEEAERTLPTDAFEQVQEWAKERDHILAKAEERANKQFSKRMNKLFKTDYTGYWWSYSRYGGWWDDLLTKVVYERTKDQMAAVVEKLKAFRETLGPTSRQHRPSITPLTPEEKAKVLKRKNTKAVALLEQFTDTLEAK